MEPAKIDWNRLDSRFVQDYVYEHINTPKWVDFLSLDQHPIDDHVWFCTPGITQLVTIPGLLRIFFKPPRHFLRFLQDRLLAEDVEALLFTS
ncbi:hypothetical protein V6N13_122728 [Hibiscus sabdariffa]